MHYLEHQKEGREGFVAIKLDMSKTYDRVEWGFIKQVMEKMGFHDKWIKLIMHCITSVSYSIFVNGVAYGSIIPTRGLREGGPISPYIFLLCADGFSSLINDVAKNQRISGVSICKGYKSHIYFLQMTVFCFVKQIVKNAKILLIFSSYMKLHQVKKSMQINLQSFSVIIPQMIEDVKC